MQLHAVLNPYAFKGMLRLNFRPVKMDQHFNVVLYALGVSNELLWALECLEVNRAFQLFQFQFDF